MKINIYASQRKIEKTYETDAYDLMYGTVEDILGIFDNVDTDSDAELFEVVAKNRDMLNRLLLDIFPDMTKEELRRTKIKELVPLFIDLFNYVKDSLSGNGKN